MTSPGALPAETLRLFDGYDEEELAAETHRDFVTGRLLEAGDRDDLHWLLGQVGEAALLRVVESRAGDGLSARSRRFWRLVLGGRLNGRLSGRLGSEPPAREELWPL